MTDAKIVTLTGVNVWRYKFHRTLSFVQLAPVAFLPLSPPQRPPTVGKNIPAARGGWEEEK